MSSEQIMVIAGLILAGLELMAGVQMGFDLVLLGSILVISGFAGIFTGGIYLSLALAAVLSSIYIFFGRKIVQSKLIVATKHTNIDKLIGKTGVTIRSITPDTAGMVRVGDEDWRAVGDEVIYEKDKVEVEAVEGVSLKVKKLKINK